MRPTTFNSVLSVMAIAIPSMTPTDAFVYNHGIKNHKLISFVQHIPKSWSRNTHLTEPVATLRMSFESSASDSNSNSDSNSDSSSSSWTGEVVSNTENGSIRGCKLEKISGSATDWVVTIDGVEADLAKFSDAIYRKITSDAKQQKFQGFRPGTIPPHLVKTYVAFAMDECAREATLEAMEQNGVRPFEDARMNFEFDTITIPPVLKKRKKKKGGRKKGANPDDKKEIEEELQWTTYDNMKEAIDAGWKPGQSFSFVCRGVKGQQMNDQNVVGAKAIGAGGGAFDLNNVVLDDDTST